MRSSPVDSIEHRVYHNPHTLTEVEVNSQKEIPVVQARNYESKQDRQCAYTITLRCVHVTIFAVEKQ
jgi:hypothetical protein